MTPAMRAAAMFVLGLVGGTAMFVVVMVVAR